MSIQRAVVEEGEWLRHCEVGGSKGNIMDSGPIGAEVRMKEPWSMRHELMTAYKHQLSSWGLVLSSWFMGHGSCAMSHRAGFMARLFVGGEALNRAKQLWG